MKKTNILLFASALLLSSASFSQTTRTPIFETFTSSTCPPCNPGNVHLEGLLGNAVNEGKFTSLKYQMSWPGTGDPYFTAEGGSRRGFYGISSVPKTEIDGSWDNNPTAMTQTDIDAAYAVPAEIELEAFFLKNEATQTVSIQVNVTALSELSGTGGLFLRVAIFEKETFNNVKSNGETRFEHVMKKMVPNQTGTYLGSLDEGESVPLSFEYKFEGDYRLPSNSTDPISHSVEHSVEEFSDLGVVVWVQRNSTKEVYQSAYAIEGVAGIDSNEETKADILTVYPNPSNDNVTVAFQTAEVSNNASLTVLDFTGKIVYNKQLGALSTNSYSTAINTENFDSGVYFVTLSTENGQKTKKLSVIH